MKVGRAMSPSKIRKMCKEAGVEIDAKTVSELVGHFEPDVQKYIDQQKENGE